MPEISAAQSKILRFLISPLRIFVKIDKHVLFTFLFRSWAIFSGALTIVILPFWLSASQQGYYYTFASLLALQVFFELGLSQVIVLLVSHEAAYLSFTDDGKLHGNSHHLARIVGIYALLRRWYLVAAFLFAIFAGASGFFFFMTNDQALPIMDWAPVWTVLVALSAINLYLSPQLAVIEGFGRVAQVAKLRLVQSIAGYGSLWVLLVLGAELWVVIVVPFISVVITMSWLRKYIRWLTVISIENSVISWRNEIFPLQWRIAVSWLSGYFIFNLFTPIVFSTHGAVEAGRLGMALSVFNAVTALGLSWINAKTPSMTMHITRGQSNELNQLFKSTGLSAVIVTATLCITVIAIVAIATHEKVTAVGRMATIDILFWIACASVVNTTVHAFATYMRAHRDEPMLPISIVAAVLTAAVAFLFREDVLMMMMAYAIVGIFVSLPWTAWIYQHKYRSRYE